MANQSPQRREVLRILSLAAAASQFPGFSRWMCAAQHAHPGSVQVQATKYEPQFFTPSEYVTVEQLTDLIIPRDDSPGAKDAGVSEFIDFMAASDPEIQQPFRAGLQWLDAQAAKTHGSAFAKLPSDQQAGILQSLAFHNRQVPDQAAGQEFFRLIRNYTVMGYYTSRIGLEQLDDPGLKFYSKSPECPHIDDPEHLRLPPPRF